jgi:hypothetical protein
MRTVTKTIPVTPARLYYFNYDPITLLAEDLYEIKFSVYYYVGSTKTYLLSDQNTIKYKTGWYYPDWTPSSAITDGYYYLEWEYKETSTSSVVTFDAGRFVIESTVYDFVPYLSLYELKQSKYYATYFSTYSDLQLLPILKAGVEFIENYCENKFYPYYKEYFYKELYEQTILVEDIVSIISFEDEDGNDESDYIDLCDGILLGLQDLDENLYEVYLNVVNGKCNNSGHSSILEDVLIGYMLNNIDISSVSVGAITQEQTDRHMVKYSINNSNIINILGNTNLVAKLKTLKRLLKVAII